MEDFMWQKMVGHVYEIRWSDIKRYIDVPVKEQRVLLPDKKL